ncbi:patatin-like phospholipase family protein [Prevotella sp. HUN102]|uniref:patatin-like phospholipase family protein n=1 Tax=Prevotella sp. HUN102 TaxID=1392486 RepID=UPI00048EFBDD|nr:patatin-like phospholipase family protein [Prevotella sp. HUN102]
MTNLLNKLKGFFTRKQQPSRKVALVLSGGGARGLAHVGAIEVLEERGYTITSVAGTSMGALVAGVYANGKLKELKELALNLNLKQTLGLINLSMGLDHVASGDKLMEAIEQLTGQTMIEDLPIPYCCIASDIVSGQERVFRKGSLTTAIRASISIPCFFKPVREEGHIDVDGSIHNTLPLDRVERTEGDMLVAINVNAPDSCPYVYLKSEKKDAEKPKTEKISTLKAKLPFRKIQFSANYMNMAIRVANLAIQANTQLALRLTPPDICAELPMDLYNMFDFNKAEELIKYGREEMTRKLDEYEARFR